MPSTPTHLLYLHGFRSSPRSTKAQGFGRWLGQHRPDVLWWCPQLPASPQAAIDMLLQGVATWPADGSVVVGSSLGGFYATVLAERLGWRAAVLNPVVDAARTLTSCVGEHAMWHASAERIEFTAAFVEELRAMKPAVLTRPERYFALIATGDELLDWREMHARYAGATQIVVQGSDHALSDFDLHRPQMLRWLGLEAA